MRTTIVRTCSCVIGRSIDEVRAQFADINYHVAQNVHSDIRVTVLQDEDGACRFTQETTVAGMRQADEIINTLLPNGDLHSDYVGGMNKGAALLVTFAQNGPHSTVVSADLRIPLSGPRALIAPIVGRGAQAALEKAIAQDKRDLESGNYARYANARTAAV